MMGGSSSIGVTGTGPRATFVKGDCGEFRNHWGIFNRR